MLYLAAFLKNYKNFNFNFFKTGETSPVRKNLNDFENENEVNFFWDFNRQKSGKEKKILKKKPINRSRKMMKDLFLFHI